MSAFDPAELQQLLLDTFILEAKEQLDAFDQELASEDPDLDHLRRIAHTLKGSSRAVGMRSAERSALYLEHYYRHLIETGGSEYSPQQVLAWAEHIRYWSEDSHARALFEKQPVALLWNTDPAQAALYASLLRREGYHTVTAATSEELKSALDSSYPPALLCVMESDLEILRSVLDCVAAHSHWAHAPALLFAPETELPLLMEIFCPSDRPAPGALMAGLESIREATA